MISILLKYENLIICNKNDYNYLKLKRKYKHIWYLKTDYKKFSNGDIVAAINIHNNILICDDIENILITKKDIKNYISRKNKLKNILYEY